MEKRQWEAYHALRQVAKKEGISVQQVILDIEEAITEAYFTAKKEDDQPVLERWNAIPSKGEIPTALELVAYLGDKLQSVK